MARNISVMIVDDEKLALEDIMTLVDWESLGFSIVATAINGKQALARFKTFTPDVILTDIRMPVMDGLEFVKEVRKTGTPTTIIMLTAYADFAYAQKAINYGVDQYLLKSDISAQSLTGFLTDLNKTISLRAAERHDIDDRRIADYWHSENEAALSTSYRHDYYFCLIEQDEPLPILTHYIDKAPHINGKALISVIENAKLPSSLSLRALSRLDERHCLVILKPIVTSVKQAEAAVSEFTQILFDNLENTFSGSFTLFTTDFAQKLPDFRKLCRTSRTFSEKYLKGCHMIYTIKKHSSLVGESAVTTDSAILHAALKAMTDFTASFESENEDDIRQKISAIYRPLLDIGAMDALLLLSRRFYSHLSELYISSSPITNQEPAPINREADFLDYPRIINNLADGYLLYNHFIQEASQAEYSKPVKMALAYIRRNFKDPDLSVNDIAEHIHLSSAYISDLFRSETGTTLKSYLTDLRIEEAIRMLENGSYHIYEISEHCGYRTSQYFTQVFFKKTGTYPSDYKKTRS